MGANDKTVLKEIGTVVGRNFAIEQLDNKMRPDKILTILGLLFNQSGWGKVIIDVNLESRSGSISVENCVLARHTEADEANCIFLKGYFKGLIETLTKVKVVCNEVTCMANGDDICRFEVKQF